MEREIIFSEKVELYLDELMQLLFDFGKNMKYITYQANKRTFWYIFYQERNYIYLIRHITNNHVAAQHFI